MSIECGCSDDIATGIRPVHTKSARFGERVGPARQSSRVLLLIPFEMRRRRGMESVLVSMRTAVVWMRLEKSGGARNGVLLVKPAAIGPLPKYALARTLRMSRRDDTQRGSALDHTLYS